MPIYEFVCQQCRGLTELLVRNTKDKIEMKCSDCGSTELQRVLSSVNSVVSDGAGQGGLGRLSGATQIVSFRGLFHDYPSGTFSLIAGRPKRPICGVRLHPSSFNVQEVRLSLDWIPAFAGTSFACLASGPFWPAC